MIELKSSLIFKKEHLLGGGKVRDQRSEVGCQRSEVLPI